MKYQFSIAALLLVAVGSANAQVASHAPTAVSKKVVQANQSPDKPVVRVNGIALTESDLVREMYTIFPYARQHNGGFPKAMEPEIRKGAKQMIVFEELVYQEALRRKMTITPARMTKAQAEFRRQFASEAEYQAVINQDFHGSTEALRKMIRRSLLIDALLKSDIDAKSPVSLAEARAYYDKHPEKFSFPESIEFQSISVMPPENPNPQQQKEAGKRAEDFLKQAKATKNYQEFGLLAEKISEDDYRVNMGDHKAVPKAELPPEIVKAALALKPGQVSDLIKLGSAYTIIRLNKHVPAGKNSFAEVRDALRKNLQKDKTDRLRADLGKRLRKTAKVEEL